MTLCVKTSSPTAHVAVLVLDDSNMLSLAAAIDPLRAANRRAGRQLYKWQMIGPTGGTVQLTSGMSVPVAPVTQLLRADLLIVVAAFNLAQHATPALLASLRRLAPLCRRVAAIDGGPWLIAKAGLLNGHCATTHWEDLESFAAQFDQIEVKQERFVISGKFASSGGAAPTIDMMLHLIAQDHGAELSARVASALIYDPGGGGNRPQSLTATARLQQRHPIVARAVAMMEAQIDEPLPIHAIADRLGLSSRHLETRFQRALGQPPKRFYLDLRLSEARRLAQDTNLAVSEIAQATGFPAQSSLSRAFQRRFGQSIRALRQG